MTLRRQTILAVILSVSAGITCAERVTGPSSTPLAQLRFAPSFSKAAAQIYKNLETFGLGLDNLRIQLLPADQDGAAVKDTVVLITEDDSEISVDLRVPVSGPEQRMRAHLDLRDGQQVLFSATQDVLLRAGLPSTRPEPVELDYIGPGANAATLVVGPATASIFANDSVSLTAIAFDAGQQSVPVTAIAWDVTDATRGTVSTTGMFKPSPLRGLALVVGRLPTGLRDTASISVIPVPSQIALISGGAQSGTVGTALTQPIVVEPRGADNLPVAGFAVSFAVTAGGGSLSTTTATSDASGRANTVLTLGTIAGGNTVTATSGTGTLPITATGTPGPAARLAMVQQPSATAISGTPLTTQPSVRIADAFGNAVSTAGVVVQVTPSTGIQLGGTLTATTNASGVAAFGNLALNGLAGPATLSFSSGNLTGVTSANIALSLPAPGAVSIVSGEGQGSLPGGGPLPNPIVVRATDASGNPRVGTTVTFTVVSGGGILDGDFSTIPKTTNANGEASVIWSPNTGPQEIRATTSDASVDIHAFIGERLVVAQQPTLDPQSGVTLVQQPVVRFMDNAGNVARISGAQIVARLTLVTGGQPTGFLSGTTTLATDANGVATFTDMAVHGPSTEPVQLRFHHQLGAAENTQVAAGLSSQIGMRAGSVWQIQPVGTGRAYTTPGGQASIQFRVLDLEGFNGVSGIPVSFSVITGQACTPVQPSATSDATGLVTMNVTGTTGFTSCFLQARVEQDVVPPVGPPFRPAYPGFVVTVDAGIPTWVGGDAGNPTAWTTRANWLNGVMPGAEPTVFIPGFTVAIPRLATATSVQSLHIENTGSLDLNGQQLDIADDLVGGGIIAQPGTVVLRATSGGLFNAFVGDALVQVGTSDPPCTRGTVAYDVQTLAHVSILEINCELRVGDGDFLSVNQDLHVGFFNGGLLLGGSGSVTVARDVRFLNGVSQVAGNSVLVTQGTLTVEQNGALQQTGGVISVTGDAAFHGAASFSAGTLDLGRNLLHTGNGQSNAFVAVYPHQTILRGSADPLQILWDTPGTSRFGQLDVLSSSAIGYTITNSAGAPGTIAIHDLAISSGARLVVPTFITLNTGAVPGGPYPGGLGVSIVTGGALTNNGQVTVAGSLTSPQGCSPLARTTTIQGPFSCVSQQ